MVEKLIHKYKAETHWLKNLSLSALRKLWLTNIINSICLLIFKHKILLKLFHQNKIRLEVFKQIVWRKSKKIIVLIASIEFRRLQRNIIKFYLYLLSKDKKTLKGKEFHNLISPRKPTRFLKKVRMNNHSLLFLKKRNMQ